MEGDRSINRRALFRAGLSAGLIGLTAKADPRSEGCFVNEAWLLGHRRRDHGQFRAFEQRLKDFRGTGQYTIPMEIGARLSPLDQLSMADWLKDNRFDSPYLRWYIDYACRDDYGALARNTSAWAGIHYFASRDP